MKRWELVQRLFDETAELAAEDRARVLRERAGGDAELVRSVEELLAADAAAPAAFERSATDLLLELRDDGPAAEALCGATFGAYRVDEHVASGGMAHVYRATRRSAGTERRVALKVLRPGLDTEAFLHRFRRERATLAALEHEHVVAFLDAGALPDGRPYLVMEYVEGAPLTVWARRATLRRRLELFLQVLAAVQYAHQQLVVHRDLKPSNVLVTAQGVPKLLDFGVATALEADGDAGARLPLTPAYASPEQLAGGPVTTASDVHSLGVLLHELVTGELPAAGPHGPRSTIGGDLGAIVSRAVAHDAAARYRSPDHLADDLRRHLAREPVSARPATWTYRAGLFARRHRAALGLALAVVAASVTGWVASDLARRRAERNASTGWGAHAEAKAATRVLERWMAAATAADPALAADAAEHLERSLREDLDGLPEAETLVRLALAELYLTQGDAARAAEHAERAHELAQATPGVGRAERERAEALRARTAGR